jgi:predicted Zn finger-like uncharacterized protein
MLIVCPSCTTSYQVEPAALGPSGRSVRCAHCKDTWFAAPSEMLAEASSELVIVAPRAPMDEPLPDPAPPDEMPRDVEPIAPVEHETAIAPAEAPPLVPEHLPEAAQLADIADIPAEASVPGSIETVAARRAPRARTGRKPGRSPLRRLASLPLLIVALSAALIAVLQWRDKVVRQVPQMASLFAAVGLPVNLRGFAFEGVTSSTEISDGMPVLIVEGTIVNVTPRPLEVPRLRFALRNSAGHEVYAWTTQPAKPTLGSGNGLAFRTRLASPPPDGRDVIVRFFNRRDMTAGLR